MLELTLEEAKELYFRLLAILTEPEDDRNEKFYSMLDKVTDFIEEREPNYFNSRECMVQKRRLFKRYLKNNDKKLFTLTPNHELNKLIMHDEPLSVPAFGEWVSDN